MQLGQINRVPTVSTTDLTAACAQNAMITVDIQNNAIGAGGSCRGRIKALIITSDQNLAWEVNYFGTADFVTLATVFETVHLMGRYAFAVGDGLQIAGAGPFYYYIDGLDIAYEDLDITSKARNPQAAVGKLHIGLVNRSATAKNAGATGKIKVTTCFEPTLTGA